VRSGTVLAHSARRLDRTATLVSLVDLAPAAPRIRVAVELLHKRATVAVTQLLGDQVRAAPG